MCRISLCLVRRVLSRLARAPGADGQGSQSVSQLNDTRYMEKASGMRAEQQQSARVYEI